MIAVSWRRVLINGGLKRKAYIVRKKGNNQTAKKDKG